MMHCRQPAFDLAKFNKDINDVDEDLRQMALFDLQKYVTQANSCVSDAVVLQVLDCLSTKEHTTQVRTEAVEALPKLVTMCTEQQQLTIVDLVLSQAIASKPAPRDQELMELYELSSLAIKKVVNAIVEMAQRDATFWQRSIANMQRYFHTCVNHLNGQLLSPANRETMYTTLHVLLPHFGRTWDNAELDKFLDCCSKDFGTEEFSLHRCTVDCIVAAMPLAQEPTLQKLRDHTLKHLQQNDKMWLPYLQLCEAEFHADPDRMHDCVDSVMAVLLCQLNGVGEESDSDITYSSLKAVEGLIAIYGRKLSAHWERLMKVCNAIATLAPAEVETTYDDYDDDYYEDYYSSSADTTWKWRIMALRVLRAIVKASGSPALGQEAVFLVMHALRDSVYDVQLEAFAVARGVASQSYSSQHDTEAALLKLSPELALSVERGDKEAVAALKTIGCLFESCRDASVFAPSLVNVVAAFIQNSTNIGAARVEATHTCSAILASLARSSKDLGEYAARLSVAVMNQCTQGASAAVITIAMNCAPLIVQALGQHKAPAVSAAYINACAEVLENTELRVQCRNAAVEAVGCWVNTYPALSLEDKKMALTVVAKSLADESTCRSALKVVTAVTASDVATRIPQSIFSVLTALMFGVDDALKQAAAAATANLIHHGLLPSSEISQQWIANSQNFYNTADIAVMGRGLHLYTVLCTATQSPSEIAYIALLLQAWERLAKVPVTETGTLYVGTLDAAIEFGLTAYKTFPFSRPDMVRAVVTFLKSSTADAQRKSAAVRAVILPNDATAATEALASICSASLEESSVYLVLGEAGRVMALSKENADLLFASVQNTTSETCRSNGELGLAYAMPNPKNAFIFEECLKRISTPGTPGRYYYLKAIQSATSAAVTMRTCTFHNFDLCLRATKVFFKQQQGPKHGQAEDDFAQLIGMCVGTLGFFHSVPAAKELLNALEAEAASVDHVIVAVAARHLIHILSGADQDVAPLQPVVRALYSDFKRDSLVQLRTAVARLFVTILTVTPSWMHCEAFHSTFGSILTEMEVDPSLVDSISVAGYTHTVDRGVDCRKTTFDCVNAILDADQKRNTNLLVYCQRESELIDILINATSSINEKDPNINDQAKRILLKLVRVNPALQFSNAQMKMLCEKLGPLVTSGTAAEANADRTNMASLQCINTVIQLDNNPQFRYNTDFKFLAEKAYSSPLLAAALKIQYP